MRRCIGLVSALALTVALLLPSAGAVAAGTGCGSVHGFSATVEFPAGYWDLGSGGTAKLHTIAWHWPAYDYNGVTDYGGSFLVDPAAPLYPGFVHIYAADLNVVVLDANTNRHADGEIVPAVNPAQPTIAWDAFDVFGNYTSAKDVGAVRATTTDTVTWDDHASVAAKFSGVGSFCQTGGPSKVTGSFYLRSRGPKQ